MVIRARKPKTTLSTRIRVTTYNKRSLPNIFPDLPFGIEFVSAKGPSAKTADIQVDDFADEIFFLTSPLQKSKWVVSYKVKVSLESARVDALSDNLPVLVHADKSLIPLLHPILLIFADDNQINVTEEFEDDTFNIDYGLFDGSIANATCRTEFPSLKVLPVEIAR